MPLCSGWLAAVTNVRGGASLEVCRDNECPDDLRAPIFDGRDVIEWHRINDFQMVSLKQLAEQMLLAGSAGSLPLYVPGEQPRQKLVLRHRPLVFVSPDNPGAAAVADDLRRGMSNAFEVTSAAAALPTQLEEGKHRPAGGASHVLLYLNDQTYLGEAGQRLVEQLRLARAGGVKVVMVHENDAARGGCAFAIFFDGRTPEVLKDLYADLAVALYSGAFWPVSVALVAKALGAGKASRGDTFTTFGATRSAFAAPPPAAATSVGLPPCACVHEAL